MENTQEEQNWALGTLTIFVILLIISGISDFVEVGNRLRQIEMLVKLP